MERESMRIKMLIGSSSAVIKRTAEIPLAGDIFYAKRENPGVMF